ncbi:nitrilase-related carbon-nitrogen hydrolase [Actinocorallia sp. A-T 12471]|uniref:nitrilase-related carbon-nitrogen hydrolase n=1 Tax=Actinocorallia sp. A-T 12471 TaxID=3089813 RepID=UPI0029CE6F4F|nr:nitrilase-related carbon-nitrogen hydrolase [Actinocorallia sp. A-T 12471]MDX6744375.1 nitrilase-related carbon-nitrogen hydrolase [Actinocorallia sp. A-T 12471]
MPVKLRVAAVQFAAGEDVEANLAACVRMIDAAAAEGAELIVLPEFCNHLSWYESRVTAHRKACTLDGPFLRAIAERAARHGAYVKLNVTLAREGGRTTATSLLYGPDGALLGQSDKLTLMGAEGDHLDPGQEPGPIIDTAVGRIGLYACMEGVTADVTRDLSVRGAQVLLNSLNSFAVDEASLHIPVRAAENKVWVIAANKVGSLLPEEHLPAIAERLGVPQEWLHGAGESQIVSPDGTVVAKAPRTGEAVAVADIEVAAADLKVRADGVDVLARRRPELYGPIASAPVERTAPAGAEAVKVAVVASADPASGAAEAAAAGAELIVLPELAFGEAERAEVVAELGKALAGTSAHAVTSARDGDAHIGLVVSAEGEAGAQVKLHASPATPWATRLGDAVEVITLPFGRLAVVVGDDAVTVETFRLAAIADADVVAVPRSAGEPWETELGLPERAAENRVNVVAAWSEGGQILDLPADFTLWTAWEGPFTGRISHPIVADAGPGVTYGVVHPAQAVNRFVSKNTDLVGGRAWRALSGLIATRS